MPLYTLSLNPHYASIYSPLNPHYAAEQHMAARPTLTLLRVARTVPLHVLVSLARRPRRGFRRRGVRGFCRGGIARCGGVHDLMLDLHDGGLSQPGHDEPAPDNPRKVILFFYLFYLEHTRRCFYFCRINNESGFLKIYVKLFHGKNNLV